MCQCLGYQPGLFGSAGSRRMPSLAATGSQGGIVGPEGVGMGETTIQGAEKARVAPAFGRGGAHGTQLSRKRLGDDRNIQRHSPLLHSRHAVGSARTRPPVASTSQAPWPDWQLLLTPMTTRTLTNCGSMRFGCSSCVSGRRLQTKDRTSIEGPVLCSIGERSPLMRTNGPFRGSSPAGRRACGNPGIKIPYSSPGIKRKTGVHDGVPSRGRALKPISARLEAVVPRR